MRKIVLSFTLLVTAIVCLLPAAPAQAQVIRTFVSVAGSDANPCTITQPCRHFQAAVNATALGGEVDALDPGAYGSFTISQAISIEGQGWSYVAPPANGAAITINAVSGNVFIHGVSLNGVGATGGTNGIQFNSGGSLNIQDSVIRNFGYRGIEFKPAASSKLSISNTLVSDNFDAAIAVELSGPGTAEGALDHVRLENNLIGVFVNTDLGETVNLMVSDSVSANNTYGVDVQTNGAGESNVMIRNSTITNNSTAGLYTTQSGVFVRVTRSTIVRNGSGWQANSGAVVTSYADNNIDDNGSGNGAPPANVYR
jgi:hypothetical protein